ncbi:MAG: hypothetical protein J0M26_18035 [Planctomycetes bacterium]|nr:hypothetical protein [Planctomycetota bacterium]
MAWESRTHTQHKYLYLSQRDEQGKVRKKYLGRGAKNGDLISDYELQKFARRLRKQIVLITLNDMKVGQAQLQKLEDIISGIAPSFGLHNPKRRGWRKMKATAKGNPNVAVDTPISIERGIELINAAKQGDTTNFNELRAFLAQNPNFRVMENNLPMTSHLYWIDKLSPNAPFRRECLIHEVEGLKQKLRSEGTGTLLEDLTIDQITSLHLQLHYMEYTNAMMLELPDPSGKLKTERQLQIVRQNHRLALESLAKIRQLLTSKLRNGTKPDR